MPVRDENRRLRIVLVEDNPIQADLITRSLAANYEVKWFKNGRDMLSYLEGETCDFILIDHHLPKTLGLEIIEEMKIKGYLEIPTVVLVEPGKEPVVVDALKQGVFSFVIKTGSFWLYLPGLIEKGIEWSRQTVKKGSNGNGKHYLVDKLTGIPTEHVFLFSLKKEMNRSQRYRRNYSLLVLDVVNLNKINQNFGREVGDRVLRTIARGLERTIRGSDIICRYTGSSEEFSGDEFLLLLETDENGKDVVINRIKEVIKADISSLGLGIDFDVNIGYVPITGEVKDPLKLALKSIKDINP